MQPEAISAHPNLFDVAGSPGALATQLAAFLAAGPPCPIRVLVNADAVPDTPCLIARCRAFADSLSAGDDALIVTLLSAAPRGLDALDSHLASASLWAFIRQAALHWAPRRLRVNAIGLGICPAGPFESQEQPGRAAAAVPAAPASLADIARTIRAMAAWPSMTGQIIRLGA